MSTARMWAYQMHEIARCPGNKAPTEQRARTFFVEQMEQRGGGRIRQDMPAALVEQRRLRQRPIMFVPFEADAIDPRSSEEHTSEPQSLRRLQSDVFCLKKQ